MQYCGIEIDNKRNKILSEQSLKLLQDYYCREDETSPQQAFARSAACFSNGNTKLAQRIYDYVSKGYFMYSSPVLSNAILKGEKVKAFYSDDHSDVQKKASELRGKGFVVDKMGLTQPMSKLRDRIPEQVEEETELVEFTLADYKELESDNQHDIAAKKLIDKFGTSQEKSTINDINRRHAKTGYISGVDFRLRTTIVNRYYSRLK